MEVFVWLFGSSSLNSSFAFVSMPWENVSVIILGLLLEIGFVKYFTKVSWRKSVIVGATMNVTSATVGVILIWMIWLITMLMSVSIMSLLESFISYFRLDKYIFGMLDALLWLHFFRISACVLTIFVNIWIDGEIIKKMLQLPILKTFHWLFFVNTINVGMCMTAYALKSPSNLKLLEAIGIPIFVICIYGAYLVYQNRKFIKKKEML